LEKELIEYIAKALVDNPGAVRVNMIDGEKADVLELGVGEGDLGKVIGKRGRIAKALRVVLQAAGAKSGRRVVLEILD
jgi:predicted RNA-binding protein YlqC (UPF0109 family)